jgi:hypothetical protein
MRYALLFCLVLAAGFVSSAVFATPWAFQSTSARINELLPAPASDWDGDLEADSKQDEWLEIVNTGALVVDLSQLFLLNGEARAVVYGFSGTLAPGEHVVVYGRDAVGWESDNGHSSIGLSLNNSGDVLRLAEISGPDTAVVDSMTYTSSQVGYDVAVGRLPDGSGLWTLLDHLRPMGGAGLDPTPGRSNSSDAPPHVLGITRDPVYPTQDDSVHITVAAGDASGILRVLLAYQINLEDGEEPEMGFVSGTADLGTWSYTIPPCAPDDTVRYRVLLYDAAAPGAPLMTGWTGYRVRSGGLTIRLNEVLADPPSDAAGDANGDGVRDSADDEFIEILNCGSMPVDIAGWKLSDAMSVRHTFPDTGMVVAPGEFVTVFGGGSPTGFSGKVAIASSGGLSLTNAGDVVTLLDRAGGLVDICSFGGEGGRDQALIRYPDCGEEWMLPSEAGLSAAFTPNCSNGGGSAVSPSTWGGIKGLFK